MCGIAGLITKEKSTPGTVEAMIARMKHRGPDDEGFYYYNQFAVGQSRLSIIDLSGGHQPMFNHDKKLALIFNGEIYNYKELTAEMEAKGYQFATKSDSEVLVHLYEEYGVDMLPRLNGMFAFAILNTATQELFIARDRVGVKPLYIFNQGGTFAFASEIEGLRAVPAVKERLTINHEALWHYFSLLYIPPPITIYNEITHLPPGHYLIYRDGKFTIKEYWHPKFEPDESLSFKETRDQIEELIASSVKLRMQSDVPYGAYLSGGVDSSLIVGKMAAVSEHPVKTFTARIQSDEFDETPFAATVAERYRTDHTILTVEQIDFSLLKNLLPHFGQPFADSSVLPTYLVSKKIREHVTVVLGGDGGDELFAGYDKYFSVLKDNSLDAVRRAFVNRVPENAKERLFTPEFQTSVASKDTFTHLLEHPNNHGYTGYTLLRFLDLQFFLQGDILPKLDSMSMANALEAREPLLDYRLIELAVRLPQHFLSDEKRNKIMLKSMLEKYFPAPFVNRQKVGFIIPVAKWLRAHTGLVREVAFPAGLAEFFNRPYIDQLVTQFEKSGDTKEANALLAYITVAHWAEAVHL